VSPSPRRVGKAQTLRRAQAIARLRNPNLVRMLPLPGGAGLVPVVTDARSLAEFTFPSGTFRRFDLEQVVRLLLDVLAGLSALHEVVVDGERFVHGEVSPKNIYIGEYGTAKLVPLTSSHLVSGSELEVTGYSAPELQAGRTSDVRADLFSVGVMLWEALAGERLFPEAGDDTTVVVRPAAERPRRPLTRARAAWAQPLCAIAERASATDPSARYASAVELSNAIAQAVGRHLAQVNADTWQDEAPTPVFQPRLHLPTPRSTTPTPRSPTPTPTPTPTPRAATPTPRSATPLPRSATPPATVVDVPRSPAPIAVGPAFDDAPTAIAKRPPRYRALVLGVTALAMVAALGAAFGKSFDYRALRRGLAPPAQAPAAAALLPRVTAPPHVPSLPVSAPPAVVAAAAASASAIPATALSVAPTTSAKPRAKPAVRPRTKAGPTGDKADYGI
jgi:serine/threonine-protein kinase